MSIVPFIIFASHVNYGRFLCNNSTITTITKQTRQRLNIHSTAKTRGNIQTLCREKRLADAMFVLQNLDNLHIYVDSSIYSSLLQASTIAKYLSQGKKLHAHMILTEFQLNEVIATKLLSMYANCGGSVADARKVFDKMPKRSINSLSNACQVFHEMPQPNILPWNIMIRCYVIHGLCDDALTLFYQLQGEGVHPDRFTFPLVLKACASLKYGWQGSIIHNCIIKYGFESDDFVGTAIVDMYGKCGDVERARKVFDKMPQRDVVSWTSLIGVYMQNRQADEAMRIYWQMQQLGVKPNLITTASILSICAHSIDLQKGKEIHGNALKRGFDVDVFVASSLVDMYVKCDAMGSARHVFENTPQRTVVLWNSIIAGYSHSGSCDHAVKLFYQMQATGLEPNLVTWNTMIAGCAQNSFANEAIGFLYQMQVAGVKPDSVTVASVLPACAPLAALQQGKEIHGQIIRMAFDLSVFVGSALIDMYCKCGNVGIARRVFDNMLERDVVAWNAMMVGYGMYGHGKDAIALFGKMQQEGMIPDHITFLGILCACSHSGLVDKGIQFFNQMISDYRIVPRMEHYASMVDLLGRAGCLEKAENFIKNMPIKPDVGVWGTLLNACRVHGNVDLGEHVADHLFKAEDKNTGYYVLLSNIYAEAGRWNDVTKVRENMESKGLKKIPGCSWIEVNNQLEHLLMEMNQIVNARKTSN